MKRTVLIIFLIAVCCMDGFAQRGFAKPAQSSQKTKSSLGDYSLGLKIGCPWNMMPISRLDNTRYTGLFGYLIGISGERNFKHLSIGLEGAFAQKGTRMRNSKYFQTSLDDYDYPLSGVLVSQYTLAYNVFTVRAPITWHFVSRAGTETVVPYIFLGPEMDLSSRKHLTITDGFHFHYGDPLCVIKKKEIIDGNMGGDWISDTIPTKVGVINTSIVGGAGVMITLPTDFSTLYLKADIAVNYGLNNLAANNEGSIRAHDVEINFKLVYPLKKRLHDASWSFRQRKRLFGFLRK